MALNYSQTVLRKLLTLYLTHPEQLTEHEQQIADRICSCSLEEWLWIRRKKRIPLRCPHCHKHAWNRPMLEQINAIELDRQAKALAKPESRTP